MIDEKKVLSLTRQLPLPDYINIRVETSVNLAENNRASNLNAPFPRFFEH